jgi:hypothetical protein
MVGMSYLRSLTYGVADDTRHLWSSKLKVDGDSNNIIHAGKIVRVVPSWWT